MNKPIASQPGDGVVPHKAPDCFELDEIEWEETEYSYPSHLDLIPFKNTMKKIIEEFEHILAQAKTKALT